MVRPNDKFNLSVKDIKLIETSLRHLGAMYINEEHPEKYEDIKQLLGKIHNQKTWYRPAKNYVSG